MKNLFKKMMLVAVAAMAFTACSQDVNEVNKVEKVTRYEFTANIADDTRSGFAEKEEGATAYKSEWHEGDQVKIFIDGYNDPVVTDIDTEGKFELELTNAPETFFMTVCAPANAWTGVYGWTVPTEQTPLANSVDPKAHILRSTENLIVSNGVASVQMSHFASYGKMTVNGVDFKINKVEVSFNGGTTYTINATNVQNNTFWFAISENLTVSEFTVTAYGEGDSVVTKTVSMEGKEKPLAFSWGRVSTFSVSGLEAVVAPEEPEPSDAPKFVGAKMYYSYGNTDKKIQLTGDGVVLHSLIFNLMGNTAYTYVSADKTYLNEGTYDTDYGKDSVIDPRYSTYNNLAIDDLKVTVEHVTEGYYIVVENIVVGGNVVVPIATYTGQIDGFTAPWATGGGSEPEEPSGDVVELTITEHFTIFRQGSEHEIGFYYAVGSFVDIDFIANPIVPGSYDLINGLSGMYCKSHGKYMTECTVIVTDAGGGKLTFDATFKLADDDKTYHFVYTAQIYS